MIKPEELRIGNYILNDLGYPSKVCTLGKNTIEVFFIDDDGWVTCFRPEPIPLTEELLVKAGFMIHDNSNEYWTFFVLPNGWHISLSHHTEPSAGVEKGGFYWGEEYRNYKYLHQLQNLYFALTGTELTIKL